MRPSAEDIDKILPQTQCGLCGYGGCMPYAEAIADQKVPINLCPPGGVATLKTLAQLLEIDPAPFISEMQNKAKTPTVAVIREAECIGCTKCIQACPVDAIIGSAKKMHSILINECTGCELCLPPCPVNCIDLIATTETVDKSMQYRKRYQARTERLRQQFIVKKTQQQSSSVAAKKSYIADALQRVKAKSLQK